MVALVSLWGAIFWYDAYIRSPHFKLQLEDLFVLQNSIPFHGRTGVSTLQEGPQPNASILFFNAILSNSGVPSVVKNWRVIVTPPTGDPATGFPQLHGGHVTDPQDSSKNIFSYLFSDTIFSKTQDRQITQPVSGIASFLVPGMLYEVARQPGTKLRLECEDNNGKTYSVTDVVPSVGTAYPAEKIK
jgi:hypothetical protein